MARLVGKGQGLCFPNPGGRDYEYESTKEMSTTRKAWLLGVERT